MRGWSLMKTVMKRKALSMFTREKKKTEDEISLCVTPTRVLSVKTFCS